MVGVEEAVERHRDLHLDVDVLSGGLSGQPLHHRVRHDLILAPLITVGSDRTAWGRNPA